ncbi:MAG: phage major capsid protein [Clostridia bacterium]|nr:phage major capsid protein [Clostridia bacterium]
MITLTNADKALKEVYLGVVSEQLNTSVNPLLAKINQTTNDVWGSEIKKVAPFGINGGIGAGTETGDLPVAASNNYEQFTLSLKNLYGKIEISDKAMRSSLNSAGAFVNLLNAEMEGLIKASAFNLGRMLYGDGSGKLAQIVDNTTNEIELDSVRNLVEGMVVDVLKNNGTAVSGLSAKRIVSIDRANKKITLEGVTLTAHDVKTTQSDTFFICVQGSYGKELTGLGAIFTNSGTLYGLSKSTYSWLVPYMKDLTESNATVDISDVKIQTVLDNLEETYDSKIDYICCSAGVKRNYQNYFSQYRTNVDYMDLAGGYKAISYNGIPIVSDRFIAPNTMYLLNTKEFNLHQLCDWKWLEGEDGRVIKQNAGKPTYSATLVKYADLICNKPGGQAKLTGISES